MALRRECDTLTRERDSALRESVKESSTVKALRKECEALKRERDTTPTRQQAKIDELKSLLNTHETGIGELRSQLNMHEAGMGESVLVQKYKAEKDDIEAHVRQYNPELIERQEELLATLDQTSGGQANMPDPSPTVLNNPKALRMRQNLSCLGVWRRAAINAPDGRTRVSSLNIVSPWKGRLSYAPQLMQFRQWLQNRPILTSGNAGAPGGASAVFKGIHLPELSTVRIRTVICPPRLTTTARTACFEVMVSAFFDAPV